MKIKFWIPTLSGRPIQRLFDNGWLVACRWQRWGITLVEYTNYRPKGKMYTPKLRQETE